MADTPKEPEIDTTQFIVEIIEEGTGEPIKKFDFAKVHYTGTLVNGEVFDTSAKRG